MRKAVLMLTVLMAVCAIATTASAALAGPGPVPDMRMMSTRIMK